MTNPTSNFGWQMPEPTDLVTNLPADFEVFGQAVDTDFVDLLGGTTGQVLSKTSNTDLDFTWVNDASGMTNPMTTTGDIIYSSPGSTPVRLGIGSAAQVLTVASGVPSWATPSSGGGTWQSYSPTYTNFTPGNATITARYSQTGKVVTVFFSVIFGSTSSISGTPNVSLPANTVAGFEEMIVVFGKIEDVGTAFLVGGCMIVHSSQTFRWQFFPTNANNLVSDNVSATAPFTWVTGDKYATTFTYEAA